MFFIQNIKYFLAHNLALFACCSIFGNFQNDTAARVNFPFELNILSNPKNKDDYIVGFNYNIGGVYGFYSMC